MRALVGAGAASLVVFLLPAHSDAEPILEAWTGKAFTRDADLEVKQPSLGNHYRIGELSFDDESFRDPPYYGLRAAYFLERVPSLGAGVEFFHFKMIADTGERARLGGRRGGARVEADVRVDSAVQRFQISHGVNYLTADALWRFPLYVDSGRFPHGRVQPYVGFGLGPVITHAESRIEGREGDPGYELGGLGLQAHLGVRLLLLTHFGVLFEYKLTHSSLDVGIGRGNAELSETTHHLLGGICVPLPALPTD